MEAERKEIPISQEEWSRQSAVRVYSIEKASEAAIPTESEELRISRTDDSDSLPNRSTMERSTPDVLPPTETADQKPKKGVAEQAVEGLTDKVVSKQTELTTIRGAKHDTYFRIVFQFSDPFHYDEPSIRGNEATIHLKNTATKLKVFRKYRTYDAWVRLEKTGSDLNLRIGHSDRLPVLNTFTINAPYRLVVNLETKKQ